MICPCCVLNFLFQLVFKTTFPLFVYYFLILFHILNIFFMKKKKMKTVFFISPVIFILNSLAIVVYNHLLQVNITGEISFFNFIVKTINFANLLFGTILLIYSIRNRCCTKNGCSNKKKKH